MERLSPAPVGHDEVASVFSVDVGAVKGDRAPAIKEDKIIKRISIIIKSLRTSSSRDLFLLIED